VIADDALYVQAANSVGKLDRATGETIWRALEGSGEMSSSGAFSSPIVATLAGRLQLVVQTRHTLHGVGLENGEVLWSQDVPNFRGMNILTPVVYGNSILTSPYKNRTFLYSISDSEGGLTSRERWTNKVHGYMSTPVVIEGHAYLHLGNGRLACLDLETGVERWISKPLGEYWSMVTQGDKLLALDASGELYLVRADPGGLQVLATKEIASQPTWGHLAVSGNDLFVRELNAIAAYRWNPSLASVATDAP
jgi:outer membrane protein assembly factor BamB